MNLIRYYESAGNFNSVGDAVKRYLKKKTVPAIVLGGLLLGGGLPIANQEHEFYTRNLRELVVEHQKGKEDHSLPEPQELPGQLVQVNTSNAVSGDTVAIVSPLNTSWYTYKLSVKNQAGEASAEAKDNQSGSA